MSGFTFTTSMLVTLQNDYNNLGSNNTSLGAGAQIYEDILNDISQEGIIGSADGEPIYGPVPDTRIDPAVWDWFSGAIYVNENSGFAGQFVVDYTVDQYTIRTGGSSFTASDFSVASNNLAASVLFNDSGTGILQTGTLPSLLTIGNEDAGQAAGKIFQPIYGAFDAAGWAGTLLFPFLGASTYFDALLTSPGTISNDPNNLNKLNPGMYDFVAALDAQQQASEQAGLNNPLDAITELLDPTYANVSGYQNTISNAINAANAAFSSYYNLPSDNAFMPGDALVFNGVSSLFTAATWVVGEAVQSENIPTTTITGNAVIVGGTGNNTIVAPNIGTDLIDGGAGYSSTINNGYNTLDLSGLDHSLTIQSIYGSLASSNSVLTCALNQLLITDSIPNGRYDSTHQTINAYDFSELILNSVTSATFITSDGITIGIPSNSISIDPGIVFLPDITDGLTESATSNILVIAGIQNSALATDSRAGERLRRSCRYNQPCLS